MIEVNKCEFDSDVVKLENLDVTAKVCIAKILLKEMNLNFVKPLSQKTLMELGGTFISLNTVTSMPKMSGEAFEELFDALDTVNLSSEEKRKFDELLEENDRKREQAEQKIGEIVHHQVIYGAPPSTFVSSQAAVNNIMSQQNNFLADGLEEAGITLIAPWEKGKLAGKIERYFLKFRFMETRNDLLKLKNVSPDIFKHNIAEFIYKIMNQIRVLLCAIRELKLKDKIPSTEIDDKTWNFLTNNDGIDEMQAKTDQEKSEIEKCFSRVLSCKDRESYMQEIKMLNKLLDKSHAVCTSVLNTHHSEKKLKGLNLDQPEISNTFKLGFLLNSDPEEIANKARTLLNQGVKSYQEKNYQKAYEELNNACKDYQKLMSNFVADIIKKKQIYAAIGTVQYYIGMLCKHQEDFQQAKDHFEQARSNFLLQYDAKHKKVLMCEAKIDSCQAFLKSESKCS